GGRRVRLGSLPADGGRLGGRAPRGRDQAQLMAQLRRGGARAPGALEVSGSLPQLSERGLAARGQGSHAEGLGAGERVQADGGGAWSAREARRLGAGPGRGAARER